MAVSVVLVRALIEGLELLRVSRGQLLDAVNFDASRLEDADGRVTFVEYEALIHAALDLTENPALGIVMGEVASTAAHNLIAHLVVHAPTFREAIESLLRFYPLLVDRQTMEFSESDSEARLVLLPTDASERCARFLDERGLVGLSRLVQFFGQGALPNRVTFRHARPAYATEYERIFGSIAEFDAESSSVVFERALLDVPQLHGDKELFSALEAQATRRVSRLSATESYADRVRAVLMDRGPEAQDMDTVARTIGLSVRSLRRRLQEEGVAYGDLVDESRTLLAKQYLSEDRRTIEDTAYALGFSDPSAFHRAFKRLTGTTPSEFRRVKRA